MTVMVGNLEINDWFRSINNINVDLWITDPPYPFASQNGTGRYNNMYSRFTWKTLEDVFKKMYNRTADGGRAYVFCNRDGLHKTIKGLEDAGFRFLNILIWDKQHFGGGYHWRNQVEYIVYVSKGKPSCYIKGLSNVFNYKKPVKGDAISSINYKPEGTSPKPHFIWTDILTHGSCDDDICADPFSGSNPMRAALLTNPNLLNKIKDAYTNVYIT